MYLIDAINFDTASNPSHYLEYNDSGLLDIWESPRKGHQTSSCWQGCCSFDVLCIWNENQVKQFIIKDLMKLSVR